LLNADTDDRVILIGGKASDGKEEMEDTKEVEDTKVVECHACFEQFSVSRREYDKERSRWHGGRFYCSSSCIYFDVC
jgi:hypothetical protein